MLHHTNLTFREELTLRRPGATKYIVVHHVNKDGEYSVQEIHRWHRNRKDENGNYWAGIGYHFYVRKNGEIYEGRPLEAKGAHVKGHNSDSVGVCFEGNFNKEEMSGKQMNAAVLLLSLLLLYYKGSEPRRHDSLDSRRPCPGDRFPYQELIQKVRACKELLISLFGDPLKDGGFDYRAIVNLFPLITEKTTREP